MKTVHLTWYLVFLGNEGMTQHLLRILGVKNGTELCGPFLKEQQQKKKLQFLTSL